MIFVDREGGRRVGAALKHEQNTSGVVEPQNRPVRGGGRDRQNAWQGFDSVRVSRAKAPARLLYHQNALTFQFESGAVTDGGELVTRDIADRGFPLGHILMARLAKRQLPVIAHAFAEHVLSRLERPAD